MNDKEAMGNGNVIGDVHGRKLMPQLINNTHETGEWPSHFIEVTMKP
jgi:hypothetical protein